MSEALLYLLVRSARGRVLRVVRRLREPKYLLGFIVGGGWIAFWMSRFALGRGNANIEFGLPVGAVESLAGEIGTTLQLFVCLVLAVVLSVWWLVPLGRRVLEFGETELHLLLPAPISRRQLFQYGILRSQGGVLVGATLLTVFSGLRDPLTMLRIFLATWLLFTLWDLHGKVRALWLARLDELTPAQAWRRRLLLWSAIGALWIVLFVGVTEVASGILADLPRLRDDGDMASALQLLVGEHGARAADGILGWVLTPLIWLSAPLFSGFQPDLSAASRVMAWLLPGAFVVAHNEWVVRSQVRFEEAALASAKRESRKADPSARFWRSSKRGRGRVAFPLASTGRPELALVWANLMLVTRLPLRWLIGAGIGLVAVLMLLTASGALPRWLVFVIQQLGTVMILVPPLLSGRSMRNDLRTNLLKVELIRPLPLRGWRFFASQISAPVLLVMLQCAFGAALVLGIDVLSHTALLPGGLPATTRLAEMLYVPARLVTPLLVAGALPLALVTAVLSTSLENLAALAFPSWVQLGLAKKPAAAKFGQHMIVFLVLSMAMLFGLAPGILTVGAVLAVQVLVWGVPLNGWEVPLLGWLAAVPIGAVLFALIGFGGRLWDRLDPSEEILSGHS